MAITSASQREGGVVLFLLLWFRFLVRELLLKLVLLHRCCFLDYHLGLLSFDVDDAPSFLILAWNRSILCTAPFRVSRYVVPFQSDDTDPLSPLVSRHAISGGLSLVIVSPDLLSRTFSRQRIAHVQRTVDLVGDAVWSRDFTSFLLAPAITGFLIEPDRLSATLVATLGTVAAALIPSELIPNKKS